MGPTTLKTPTPSAQWLAALSPAPTMKARWAQARPSEARTWGGRKGEVKRVGRALAVGMGEGLCKGGEGQRGGDKVVQCGCRLTGALVPPDDGVLL